MGQFICLKVSKVAVHPQTVSTESGDYSCNKVKYRHSSSGIHVAGLAESQWPTQRTHVNVSNTNLFVKESSPLHITPLGNKGKQLPVTNTFQLPMLHMCRADTSVTNRCWLW